MLTIDGSRGEGGGQILRTALGLSLVTGTPFRIEKIRAARGKPGLLRQHLTCVLAAEAIGLATVRGAELRSTELEFEPGKITPGKYDFQVGTAGSTSLVLQAILPAMLRAPGPFVVTVSGGTHNMKAPPYEFLDRAFGDQLRRMGADVRFDLDRHGFFPAGRGAVTAHVTPGSLRPLDLLERGDPIHRHSIAQVAHLDESIAEREAIVVREKMRWNPWECRVERVDESLGPGNVVILEIGHEHVTEVFTGFGRVGTKAEKVAGEACREARAWQDLDVPVGKHLADQLMIPCALAGGGQFRTGPLSLHATTNLEVIEEFLDVPSRVEENDDGTVTVGFGDEGAGR
ncbi:MAG: RNA 3'-phosphate cyclase [Planctomycetes bacterium]|nr:RNA 3'-phosphate cyclase [Planctomycetota bacterium]